MQPCPEWAQGGKGALAQLGFARQGKAATRRRHGERVCDLGTGQMLSALLGLGLLSPQKQSMARKGQQLTDGPLHSLHKGVSSGCLCNPSG